jgi:hypothetical protein
MSVLVLSTSFLNALQLTPQLARICLLQSRFWYVSSYFLFYWTKWSFQLFCASWTKVLFGTLLTEHPFSISHAFRTMCSLSLNRISIVNPLYSVIFGSQEKLVICIITRLPGTHPNHSLCGNGIVKEILLDTWIRTRPYYHVRWTHPQPTISLIRLAALAPHTHQLPWLWHPQIIRIGHLATVLYASVEAACFCNFFITFTSFAYWTKRPLSISCTPRTNCPLALVFPTLPETKDPTLRPSLVRVPFWWNINFHLSSAEDHHSIVYVLKSSFTARC